MWNVLFVDQSEAVEFTDGSIDAVALPGGKGRQPDIIVRTTAHFPYQLRELRVSAATYYNLKIKYFFYRQNISTSWNLFTLRKNSFCRSHDSPNFLFKIFWILMKFSTLIFGMLKTHKITKGLGLQHRLLSCKDTRHPSASRFLYNALINGSTFL